MNLMALIIPLVVVGLILWAINSFIPMDDKIKKLLNIAVIIIVCLWILQATGLLGTVSHVGVK